MVSGKLINTREAHMFEYIGLVYSAMHVLQINNYNAIDK